MRALSLVPPEADYVKLVHADDWLWPECLERMVGLAERHPTVGLVGAYRLDEDRVGLDGLPSTVELLPGREVARSFLLGGPLPFLFGSPTSALLRADLVRVRPRFYNEANLHGDLEACIDVLSESDFGFVHQDLHAAAQRGADGEIAAARHVRPRRPRRLHTVGADVPHEGRVRPQAHRPVGRVRVVACAAPPALVQRRVPRVPSRGAS